MATKPVIRVAGSQITNLAPEDRYQYLGIHMGPVGSSVSSIDVDLLLERVETCLLKPQHKIEIIRMNVLPKTAYVADLGDASDFSKSKI